MSKRGNKEERIYISHYTKDVCSGCLHDHCYEGLCNCDFEYKNGITRQEAIRRIARVYGCGSKAEAALNALLGVEK